MSNDHDVRATGASPFPGRIKANVIQMATAVRQFWEGYLQSPNSC